jgi:hypothetical protein
LDGQPIASAPVTDGMVIHLARSGPKIQIRLGKKALEELNAISVEETMAQQVTPTNAVEVETFQEDETTTIEMKSLGK